MSKELSVYWSEFVAALPLATIGLVIALVMLMLAKPLSSQMIKPISYISSSILIQKVVRRIFSLLVILLGIYIFLRLAGLEEFAIAILSGTGVVGLIIGFAFKDIAENFISSLLLSVQKPFKIDDVIEVQGHMGVVKQVTARATTLVDFDGNHIQIPNSTVYKNVIRNMTANPKCRGYFVIGIGYDSSIIKAQQLAMDTLKETSAVLSDPEPQVLVDILASSTINLKIYFWVNIHEHSLLKVKSLLMRTIMRSFEKAGMSMPDDAREIIFPQGITVHQHDEKRAAPIVEQEKEEPKPKSNEEDLIAAEGQKVDLSSDAEDIREQAKQARDPEQGENIL
ncbi:mechanosensitive ion channel family protein [Aliiglaciecola litoralis]